MVQVVLDLAQGRFGDFDVAGFPLVLPKLPERCHVVHGVAEGVVVLVHQAKALQRKSRMPLSDEIAAHEALVRRAHRSCVFS